MMAGAKTLRDAAERVGREDSVFFSDHFIVARPLLRAITSDEPALLLIDEVDKSDPEFEAFLLEVLSDFQVTVPEIGTIEAKQQAAGLPHLEQRARDERRAQAPLPAPLHRLPEPGARAADPRDQGAGAPARSWSRTLVAMMHRLRQLDLKKTPSISETLDWARALLALNATDLDEELVNQTFNVILKYEGDVRKAQGELVEAARQEGRRGARRGAGGRGGRRRIPQP